MKLWKSAETQQTYLLPANLVREQEAELSDYAVTSDEAEAFVEAQLRSAWQQVESAFSNLAVAAEKTRVKPELVKSAESSSKATDNGKTFVEALLGVTAETVEANPDAATDSINALFAKLRTFTNSVLSDDEADLAAAQTQMANLQQTLDDHSIKTNDNMTELPKKLNQAYRRAKSEAKQYRADDVTLLADQLEEVASTIVKALREHSAESSTFGTTKQEN